MTKKTKSWLVLSLLLLAANCMQQYCVNGKPQVPCLFIFGDSLSDNGNNNLLPTSAKCNYEPYGIDFPEGPTGRFSNGRNIVDIISEHLGFTEFIPPYANTIGSDILKGVNYASGSAGILTESGKHLGANIHLGAQLKNHKLIYFQIVNRLGGVKKAKRYLKKCLYYLHIGNNDYIGNYFVPEFYQTSNKYTPAQFAKFLIHKYSRHIKELHDNLGARRFALAQVGVLGCTPNAISTHRTDGFCVEEMNNAASLFNDELRSLVDHLNNKFSFDSKFICTGNIDNSALLGLPAVVNASCCPTLSNTTCVPNQTPCHNRNEYVFWDGYHPTEAANRILAKSSYHDIKRLLHS